MKSNEFMAYTKNSFNKIKYLDKIPENLRRKIFIISHVIPFRVSNYVIEELIDWDNIPKDPIFQLTFPQPEMILEKDFLKLEELYNKGDLKSFKEKIVSIQMSMNPHPAGQMDLNAALIDQKILSGMQHKYDETVLFFPIQGQTCHSYCTYCFRWAQFAGLRDLRFASKEVGGLFEYIERNELVTDLLMTGGDPMVMKTSALEGYIKPFLDKKPGNLTHIRFGTKALAYWPYRFFKDKDSDDLMRLLEKIVNKGYHLAIMSHFSHNMELETKAVETAIKRLKSIGAQIRCQAPIVKHVNDDAIVWSKMWKAQVRLGAIPYYMFIERDTGPKSYFELPLAKAYEIYTKAYKHTSGLCRTVRGPSMSANPGKVVVEGISEINGEKVFVLKFVQARETDWTNRVFYAKYDDKASWLDELLPAFGKKEFFFEKRFEKICKNKRDALDNCLRN